MCHYQFDLNSTIGQIIMIKKWCVSDTTNFGHEFLTLRWYCIVPAKEVELNSSHLQGMPMNNLDLGGSSKCFLQAPNEDLLALK